MLLRRRAFIAGAEPAHPPRSVRPANVDGMTDPTHPAPGADAAGTPQSTTLHPDAPTAAYPPAPPHPGAAYVPAYPQAPGVTAPAAQKRRRRLGPAALTAVIAGGVLVIALSFGGGMATAWALGLSAGPGGPGTAFTGGGPGQPPRMGDGGPQSDQSWPGQRRDESDSGSEDSTGSGS